ncbi:hypothetical protein [Endozoicomonas ascidiicola]|uniref:hypothetical protein n=1 Tax=Endozoicomonas ascidiicola TaxID=1698521 RepID=UPI000831E3A0|nr:hypothetical protein [Endozoicomonas ascidiicola]
MSALTLQAAFKGFAQGGAAAVEGYNNELQRAETNKQRWEALDQSQQNIDLAKDQHQYNKMYKERAFKEAKAINERARKAEELTNINATDMVEMAKLGLTNKREYYRNHPQTDELLATTMKIQFPDRFSADADLQIQRDGKGNFNILGRKDGKSDYVNVMTLPMDEVYDYNKAAAQKLGVFNFYDVHNIKLTKDENGNPLAVNREGGQLTPSQREAIKQKDAENAEKGIPSLLELSKMDDPAEQFAAEFEKKVNAPPAYLDGSAKKPSLEQAFNEQLYNPKRDKEAEVSEVPEESKSSGGLGDILMQMAPESTTKLGMAERTVNHRWDEIGESDASPVKKGLQRAGLVARGVGESAVNIVTAPFEAVGTAGETIIESFLDDGKPKAKESETSVYQQKIQEAKNAKIVAEKKKQEEKASASQSAKETAAKAGFSDNERFIIGLSALSQTESGRRLTESKAFVEILKAAGKGASGEKAALDILTKQANLQRIMNGLDTDKRKAAEDNFKFGTKTVGDYLNVFKSAGKTGKDNFRLGTLTSHDAAVGMAKHAIEKNANWLAGEGFPMKTIGSGDNSYMGIDWHAMTQAKMNELMEDYVIPALERHGTRNWWSFGDRRNERGKIEQDSPRKEDPDAAFLNMLKLGDEKGISNIENKTGKTRNELLKERGFTKVQ